MTPELGGYVPPEEIEKFKKLFEQTKGAEIYRVTPVRKDYSISPDSEKSIDHLGTKVRQVVDLLPQGTEPKCLHPTYGFAEGSGDNKKPAKGVPEPWFQLMLGLDKRQKGLVTRAMRVLSTNRISFEKAKEIDWRNFHIQASLGYRLNNPGPQTRELLKEIFP